jgi:hypothetical protein
MKRLFQVNKPNGKIHADDKADHRVFFPDKKSAKKVRDTLNAGHPEAGYTVSYGPDHNKYAK